MISAFGIEHDISKATAREQRQLKSNAETNTALAGVSGVAAAGGVAHATRSHFKLKAANKELGRIHDTAVKGTTKGNPFHEGMTRRYHEAGVPMGQARAKAGEDVIRHAQKL